jgi:putative FmdB family regulatory protein
MPIYEYVCRACSHEFELLVMPASAAPACPSCDSHDLERLLSGFAVSSDGTRNANLRAAKKKAGTDPNRRDKRIAEQETTREHLTEDGYVLPPAAKITKP